MTHQEIRDFLVQNGVIHKNYFYKLIDLPHFIERVDYNGTVVEKMYSMEMLPCGLPKLISLINNNSTITYIYTGQEFSTNMSTIRIADKEINKLVNRNHKLKKILKRLYEKRN